MQSRISRKAQDLPTAARRRASHRPDSTVGGGYFARRPAAPPTLYVSRPCLEAEVRRRVRALPPRW
ncbi:hypothetical protein [Caldilinea sp.]|uniref:hypothetical protein n=1 Tax=Caldilinea sp. TaxID=2293560 RepID=UPI002B8CE976|nr:hypothetical protein [Caldilinea sp.]